MPTQDALDTEPSTDEQPSYALSAEEVMLSLDVERGPGLSDDEAERRIDRYGPNSLPAEPSPSRLQLMGGQLANPMNIMLIFVAVAAFVIGQIGTESSWDSWSSSTSSWVPTRK